MRDKDLYAQILGVSQPWEVTDVKLDQRGETVDVHLRYGAEATTACPECGGNCPRYDRRERR